MAANAQCVRAKDGQYCVIQSQRGFDSLTADQQSVLNEHYRMVTTQVDLIEKVGGGSCRCMLVEDWSSEIFDQAVVEGTVQTSSEFEFEITHERGDFFESDLETSEDDVTVEDKMPFSDYWDRQFDESSTEMHEALLDLDLPSEPTDIKMKAGKRFRRARAQSDDHETKLADVTMSSRPAFKSIADISAFL